MIVKGLFFVFSISLLFLFAQTGGQKKSANRTTERIEIVDSLAKKINETKAVLLTVGKKLDSIKLITDSLKTIEFSHDYRVYRYTTKGKRTALIYKWVKGSPGHWELISKYNY